MDLSSFFLTKSQATDFTTRLNTVIESLYKTDFNLEKAIASQFNVVKTDAFLKLMRENNVNTGSVTDLQNFLRKVQADLGSLPVISLTVAFEPSEEILQALSQWFVSNIGKQVLFDIQIDPTIIAGTKITYNGKFKDYSVGPAFTTLLTQMLRSVAQQPAQTPAPSPIHQSTEHMTLGR